MGKKHDVKHGFIVYTYYHRKHIIKCNIFYEQLTSEKMYNIVSKKCF